MKRKLLARNGTGVERRQFLKLSLATGAAAAMGVSAPAIAQGPKLMRFGHMLPVESGYQKAFQVWSDEVGKLSGGKLKLNIFPASQLGSIAEMLQSTQAGSQTFGTAVPAWYSNFAKPFDAFTLPYLIADHVKLRKGLEGRVGRECEKLGESVGFHFVGYYLLGSRHIVNRLRPVHKPEDCKGMKVRVINSQVYMQTFRALGANPVAMDPSELYLAMQQGVIDGFEYPLPDLLAFKLQEVSKFVSLDAHTTDFFLVATSNDNWKKFSKEEQEIIMKAMKTSMDYQWVEHPKDIDASGAKLKTLLAVNEITPENKKLFIEATLPVRKQFESTIGREFLEMAIKELA